MNRILRALIALLILGGSAVPEATAAPSPIRRLAIVAGSNLGSTGRLPLRYAVADADRFAQVITSVGGVQPGDCLVLRDPTRRDFLEALQTARGQALGIRASGGRVDVLVYYSGHADEQGLLLGPESLEYAELRAAIHEIDADVGITILDACASGAITRLKGGQVQPAFLSDVSNDVRGYAFLTASSGTEAAQESERLRGSFFTHALLTALRGAADVSGDSKVSFGEAYQFAFNETLAQTTSTEAGAQHPSYDIKMAGTGDVVLTDLRQTSSSILLGAEYEGRFFVFDTSGHLVAELQKPYGRPVELALEPGEYKIYFEQPATLLSTSLQLEEGARQELDRQEMHPSKRVPTRRRGPAPEEAPEQRRDWVNRGTRVQALFGLSETRAREDGLYDMAVDDGLIFSHWVNSRIAADLSILTFRLGGRPVLDGAVLEELVALQLGIRYSPRQVGRFRPFVLASAGPYFEVSDESVEGGGDTRVVTKLGGIVGAGVEFHLGRGPSLSFDSRINLLSNATAEVDFAFGVAWTFGQGKFRR